MKIIAKIKKSDWVLIGICILTIVLNVISRCSAAFSDWYTANIFPLWQNTYGRLTSAVPFSFGEILIIIGVVGIPVSLIAMIILLICKKGKRFRIFGIFARTYLWIIGIIAVIQTLNCFILYHCSSFAELNGISSAQHTNQELEQLGNWLVSEINSLAVQVERDKDGKFVLTADVDETAKKSMKNLSEEFKNLGGFYVTPKPVKNSFFMSQLNLMGIYFPFSMEANYNNEMYKAKLPDTVCHELAHTKGYIQEDEANFIAFAACDRSGNADYRYSGYISALSYVRNKIFEYADDNKKIEFDSSISDAVWADIDANREYWQEVKENKDAVFDSETVSEISDKAMESSLKLNGVEDGKQSYGRMVDLMLNYYLSKINK